MAFDENGFWLGDFQELLEIDLSPSPTIQLQSSAPSASSNSLSTTPTLPKSSPQPSAIMMNPTTTDNHSGRSAIIGGAVGGGVALIILVWSTIIFQRRRRIRTEQAIINPYPVPGMISKVVGNRKRQRSDEGPPSRIHTDPEASAPNYIEEFNEDRKVEPVQQSARRVRYHDDSGWRPLPAPSEAGDSSVLDIPPHYDAAM
ncbi:hypothetical protein VNI00_015617 [Paramarasmius palmivorus]|uniref:Uncharacterized protein n=1 Tax=Paramarasmius palmivorus TaxID=297713 RepID=A0AAW0BKJ7_9AGAR